MNTTLVQGEVYERPLWWWIVAGLLLLLLIILSLRKADWIGVVLLLLFIGVYALFERFEHSKKLKTQIIDTGLVIGDRSFSWGDIQGYSIGYKGSEKIFHTLYIYTQDGKPHLFTFLDTQENIKLFAQIMSEFSELVTPPRISGPRRLQRLLRI